MIVAGFPASESPVVCAAPVCWRRQPGAAVPHRHSQGRSWHLLSRAAIVREWFCRTWIGMCVRRFLTVAGLIRGRRCATHTAEGGLATCRATARALLGHLSTPLIVRPQEIVSAGGGSVPWGGSGGIWTALGSIGVPPVRNRHCHPTRRAGVEAPQFEWIPSLGRAFRLVPCGGKRGWRAIFTACGGVSGFAEFLGVRGLRLSGQLGRP